jgi:putative sterol carrier protein
VNVESAREFFEGLPARIDPERARALDAAYRFDIDGAGSWRVESEGDRLVVGESDAPADCVIRADERTFLRIVRGEQSPMGAYMTGKVRVEGDVGLALKLRELLG